ncbi:phage holin family protein [Kutzneria sp. NPDC051319]|uniref:phage holin family protein n=1 Tax=Kutzneria sp. NPDC051319 TaxID=3155047 RepID=UPI0034405C9C
MTVRPEPGRPDVENASIGDLMGNVSRDLSTLLRQELALAKTELKVEAGKAGRGGGMLAGAGLAGWMVLLFLSVALWVGLSAFMDSWLAALIVAVIWGVVAAVLYTGGRRQLKSINPKPDQTAATLKQVPDAMKGH